MTVGFSITNQMLIDAAHYGHGLTAQDPYEYTSEGDPKNYFNANNQAELLEKLEKAIEFIQAGTSSSGSASSSGAYIAAVMAPICIRACLIQAAGSVT